MSAGWTLTDPGAGDTGALAGMAGYLDELASQLLQAREQTQGAMQPVPAAWSGTAAEAWWSRATETVTDLASAASQLDARAMALHTYVASVRDIASRAWPWRRQLVGSGSVVCAAPGLVDAAAARADARARVRLAALAAERRTADATAASGLGAVQVGEWVLVGAALITAGVVAPSQLDGSVITAALARRVEGMLAAGLTDADVAALSELLTQWSGDETAMSAFFTTLGGERTAALLDALGRGVRELDLEPDPALALALLVQSGLSVGSRHWDRTTAAEFVAGLLEHPGAGAVAQLLFTGDPAVPMGEQLTVAVLDAVDQAERLDLALPWIASDLSGAAVLLALRDGDAAAGWPTGIAEIVLTTLALYPDAALDWVVGGGAGDVRGSRIDYWFGERDWADGFEAVAGLWAAVQQVPGGPASGVEGYDPARWDALIAANESIFTALDRNEWYTAGGASTEAKLLLVDAVGGQLAELMEKSLYGLGDEASGQKPVDLPGLGYRTVPVLDPDLLARVLGVILSDGEALTAFAAEAERFQNTMLSPDSGYEVIGAIDRSARLQGLVDGATGGLDMSLAAARDARVDSLIGMAGQGAGLAASAIPNPLAGAATGPVISLAGAGAGWLWSGEYEQVAGTVGVENHTQQSALRAVVAGLVDEHVTEAMLVEYGRHTNVSDPGGLVDAVVATYHGAAGTAQGAAS